jgi:hypothetical protein
VTEQNCGQRILYVVITEPSAYRFPLERLYKLLLCEKLDYRKKAKVHLLFKTVFDCRQKTSKNRRIKVNPQ